MPSQIKACDILIVPGVLYVGGHSLIATGDFKHIGGRAGNDTMPNGQGVVHANNQKGAHEAQLSAADGALVYRSNSLQTDRIKAERINDIAMKLCGTPYEITRVALAGIHFNTTSDDTFDRLIKYSVNLRHGDKIMGSLYCSELVIVSVQLGLEMDEKDRAWIKLDGKTTWPSTLRSWFDTDSTDWQLVGRVQDSMVVSI